MSNEPSKCEYLINGRLCNAIMEQPEGRDIRKEFCKNSQKNYCCYLCAYRENCEISCSFLDTPRKSTSLDSSFSSKGGRKVKTHEEEKIILSGEIIEGGIFKKTTK
ncbi:MAG: hypothetical protein ACPLKZ_02695, partial [Candidatus Bathyarchaeales archaeon]